MYEHWEKGPEFFINSNNYVPYDMEMEIKSISKGAVKSISLDCTGHGSFVAHKVAARFVTYL